jgi:zinc/manganese transport system ATP-binding protein
LIPDFDGLLRQNTLSTLGYMPSNGITLTNLTLSYHRHPAVHHLSGTFPEGSMTAIMGPNGGGKSTLIRALAGLHPLDEGTIFRAPGQPLDKTAYLPQSLVWDRQFPLSVFELAAQALLPELGLWKCRRKVHDDRIMHALEQVGLADHKNTSIGSLSLGQFQRALFARVIVQNAQVILLDEPLTGLDEKSCEGFFRLIHQWNQEGRTLIVVLHDRNLALEHFATTLVLSKEARAWGPSRQVLEPQSWQETLVKDTYSVNSIRNEECAR